MFADSLIDTAWTDRSRRGWTTLASFVVQIAAVGGLLLLPLLYTQGLPQVHLLDALVAPVPPPTAAPAHLTDRRDHQQCVVAGPSDRATFHPQRNTEH